MRNVLSHILVLMVGATLGGGVMSFYPNFLSGGGIEGRPASASTENDTGQLAIRVSELEKELSEYKVRVSDAAKQIAAYEAAQRSIKVDPHCIPPHGTEESNREEVKTQGDGLNPSSQVPGSDASKWRISAIEKFVPLTSEQKERLTESYRAKSEGRKGETLEEILGNESAQYYREQVNSAFRRMRTQELEKEIVFTSRKLQLTEIQEGRLREIYKTIEDEISTPSTQGSEISPQERVKQMVEEGKRRAALRAEKTKEVLTPQQYQEYLKSEAESPEADMQVFHDSGE
jgi:hypothetical protein